MELSVSSTLIENVCLVKNLKHNLLSISRLCDKGYRVIFYKSKCVIENACDGKVLFVGNRCVNVYTINIVVHLQMINVSMHCMMTVGYGIEN